MYVNNSNSDEKSLKCRLIKIEVFAVFLANLIDTSLSLMAVGWPVICGTLNKTSALEVKRWCSIVIWFNAKTHCDVSKE